MFIQPANQRCPLMGHSGAALADPIDNIPRCKRFAEFLPVREKQNPILGHIAHDLIDPFALAGILLVTVWDRPVALVEEPHRDVAE